MKLHEVKGYLAKLSPEQLRTLSDENNVHLTSMDIAVMESFPAIQQKIAEAIFPKLKRISVDHVSEKMEHKNAPQLVAETKPSEAVQNKPVRKYARKEKDVEKVPVVETKPNVAKSPIAEVRKRGGSLPKPTSYHNLKTSTKDYLASHGFELKPGKLSDERKKERDKIVLNGIKEGALRKEVKSLLHM